MNPAKEFISDIAENISMPEVYRDIRSLITMPDAEIQDFVETIGQDSMLSVRIVRIANTPFFGFPRKAHNLREAISLTGVMQLHDLVLSCLIMRTFSSVPKQVFNMKAFWNYSVTCGIAAKTIAQYSMSLPINLYFSLGLLHEIGHAAMYARMPGLSLTALQDADEKDQPITVTEQKYFGFDYAQIGAQIMQIWELPELYQQAASYHDFPESADNANRHTINILHLAHAICQNPMTGANQDLINKAKNNDPQLHSLPENIEDLVIREIALHAESVVDVLWPYGVED